MGKKCTRFKRVAGGKRRCAKFGGLGGHKSSGRKKKCLKWSKGRKRCLKRAKR